MEGHAACLFTDGWALGLFLPFRDPSDLFCFSWVCPWDGIAGSGTFQELSACSPKQLPHLTSSDRISELSWPFNREQPWPHSASRSATLPRPVVFPPLPSHLLRRFSLLTDFAQGFQASLHLKLKHRRHQRSPFQSWLTCSFISGPRRPHRAHVTAPWTNTEPGSRSQP